MDEREKALYQEILALTIPDLRNELEHYSLPTTGTRTTCIQRLFKYKRQQLAKESVSKTNKPKRVMRPTARAQGQAEQSMLQNSEVEGLSQTTLQNFDIAGPSTQSDAQQGSTQSFVQSQTTPNETLERNPKQEYSIQDIEQRVEKIPHERLAVQLAEWQDKFLQTLAESQLTGTKSPVKESPCVENNGQPVEASTPFKNNDCYEGVGVTQLIRKQRFLATSIGVVIREMRWLIAGDRTHKQLSKALECLNSLEKEYSGVVQELIAILPSEEFVTDEVNRWAAFQQEILEITMLAEQQISTQSEIEDSKRQLSTTEHSNPVSSNLRLPKFTLSEFTGNIIQWVSWWDQYKICIHENEALTDRDRFNYLRMYVKGTARRAIEYIEVSGDKLLQASNPETKRSVVSISSKLFNPLGFLSPYTIRAKILYQKLWIRGASWDDSLEEEIRNEWRRWKEQLKHLNLIRISRPLLTSLSFEIASIQLHGYSDASPNAYGAVTYLRIQECTGNVRVQILFAKTRVAPTKRITLPRLELMAAYLLAKMTAFLLKALGEKVQQYSCWSDSMITLSWIRRPSHDWKVFVANRVQAIQEKTDPERWRFCPGDTNPADLEDVDRKFPLVERSSVALLTRRGVATELSRQRVIRMPGTKDPNDPNVGSS